MMVIDVRVCVCMMMQIVMTFERALSKEIEGYREPVILVSIPTVTSLDL